MGRLGKGEIIALVVYAAGMGALLGPTGLAILATIFGFWWLYREIRRAQINRRFERVSGSYSIPLVVPGFDDLVCDLTYEAVSGIYKIRSIQQRHQADDVFDQIPPDQAASVNRQIDEYIQELRRSGGIARVYADYF